MKTRKIICLTFLVALTLACRTFSTMFDNSGILLTIEVKSDKPNIEQITENAANVVQSRIDAIGVNGKVAKTSPNRLEVKIYGAADMEKVKRVLLAQGNFEISKVVTAPYPALIQFFPTEKAAIESLGGNIPENRKVLPYAERDITPTQPNHLEATKKFVVVENPPVVDGGELRDARAFSETGSDRDYKISFSLKPAGAQKFADWTGKNINNYLAIVLNDEVKTAAFIKSQISDSGEITGSFTKASAEEIALVMRSGYLPAKLVLVEEKTFGK